MDAEDFTKQLRKSIIEDNLAIYKDLFQSTDPKSATDPYWVRALALHGALDDSQKSIFYEIVRQVMADTVSNMLGVIDGVSTLEGADDELRLLTAKGNKELSGDLQDTFLEQEEEA